MAGFQPLPLHPYQGARTVGDIIMNFEAAFTEHGKSAEWLERYDKHFDRVRVLADQAKYNAKVAEWDKRIEAMSNDVAALNGAPELKRSVLAER